jgi:SAM-dependent methyltransferase
MSSSPPSRTALSAEARPRIIWDETNCLLCGGRHWLPLVEARDAIPDGSGFWFVVVQCQECGLCFTNPRPAASCMHQFYPTSYRPHRASQVHHERTASLWRRWAHRERVFLPRAGEGRLLDFGCGGGSFLQRMHRQGWQVTGLDASPETVQRIRGELGLEAVAGSLPCAELEGRRFDVITLWHSLEHVHQPLAVLREARRLLAPRGRLVVAVPNIDSLPFRWFSSAWYGLDLPRHLTQFTPPTLRAMLERAGFQVGPIRMIRHSKWLRASAERACQDGRGTRWQRWLRGKYASRLASWYCCWTGRADAILVTAVA